MHYRNIEPTTGIETTARYERSQAYTVTVRVPAYDGSDDEESLRMQARAAQQLIFSLDVLAKAVSYTREESRDA